MVPSLVGSLITCVRKLSSTHCSYRLVCFFSVVLYFQQTPGKLKSPMRTSSSNHDNSPRYLYNISSAFSSWLSGIEHTPTIISPLLAFLLILIQRQLTPLQLSCIQTWPSPKVEGYPTSSPSLPISPKEPLTVYHSTLVMQAISLHPSEVYDITVLRPDWKFQFPLFISHAMSIYMYI